MTYSLRLIFIVAFCACSYSINFPSVMAQTERPAQRGSSGETNSPEATCPAAQTITSGSGASKFSFCISNDGNLVSLESPAGYSHLNGGAEGYVLCSSGGVHGYDDDSTGGVGWNASTVTQTGGPNTLPLDIVRTTTDGKFQLRQTFDQDTAHKEIIVTMVLKNLSAAAITSVKLSRYFNGYIDAGFGDDIYDADADSVWGRDSGTGAGHHGLMLGALSFATTHTMAVEDYADWYPHSMTQTFKTCTPIPQSTPTAPGDFVGRLTFSLGTLNAGTTKTLVIVYRRF